jgi:hypothetical protein
MRFSRQHSSGASVPGFMRFQVVFSVAVHAALQFAKFRHFFYSKTALSRLNFLEKTKKVGPDYAPEKPLYIVVGKKNSTT